MHIGPHLSRLIVTFFYYSTALSPRCPDLIQTTTSSVRALKCAGDTGSSVPSISQEPPGGSRIQLHESYCSLLNSTSPAEQRRAAVIECYLHNYLLEGSLRANRIRQMLSALSSQHTIATKYWHPRTADYETPRNLLDFT